MRDVEERDAASFRARLKECVAAAGSLASFARTAGLPTNTVRRYLTDSEPTRPKLVAMAAAARVPVMWLATGIGPKNDTIAQFPSVAPNQGFTARLQQLVELEGGLTEASAKFGISAERLTTLLAGAEMAASELRLLCKLTRTPPSWLLNGRGLDALDQLNAENRLSELLARIEEIDEERDRGFRRLGEQTPSHSKWSDGANLAAVFDLWLKIFERMPPAAYRVVEIRDNLMSPTLEPGDLVVVRSEKLAGIPGLYLFRNGSTEFIARCVSMEEGAPLFFDNPKYGKPRPRSPNDDTECIGQVCFCFAVAR